MTQLQFHGHNSRGDREIEACHCFNGATEAEGSVIFFKAKYPQYGRILKNAWFYGSKVAHVINV
jgi:hypothetical protein